ncbi:rCG51179 [Rattus norvegicus]|uniref:RCG51179 n=1 Tax=Rattus norvegicus TaxID=10116 RepID=A6IZC8_RAT|nr:rCG51179 [Rattus norvegicus]
MLKFFLHETYWVLKLCVLCKYLKYYNSLLSPWLSTLKRYEILQVEHGPQIVLRTPYNRDTLDAI